MARQKSYIIFLYKSHEKYLFEGFFLLPINSDLSCVMLHTSRQCEAPVHLAIAGTSDDWNWGFDIGKVIALRWTRSPGLSLQSDQGFTIFDPLSLNSLFCDGILLMWVISSVLRQKPGVLQYAGAFVFYSLPKIPLLSLDPEQRKSLAWSHPLAAPKGLRSQTRSGRLDKSRV